jgi:mannosyltransferase OCH1-like enzyme
MIPKIIHYCWFGNNKKPRLIKKCISSWKKILPDYEIIEWNESNCDLSHPFLQKFYTEKKWAFVSDFIRLKVLRDYGGIYLDTDMLVVNRLDDLLDNNVFFGAENSEYIGAGVIGSVKNNFFISKCLERYDTIDSTVSIFEITIPKIITSLFLEFYLESKFDSILKLNNITIYPNTFFYPFPEVEKNSRKNISKYISSETYAIHLWYGSWLEFSEFHYLRKGYYFKALKKMIFKRQNKITLKYIRKIFSCVKESLFKK